MRLRRTLTLALTLAALAPGTAAADGVRVLAREEPVAAVRASQPRPAPFTFTLVGVHWQGAGEVSFRTAAAGGGWSAWHAARPEDEDVPDPGTAEAGASAAWKVGNPWWSGEADRIQYRLSGEVRRLRAVFVSSPVTAADAEPAEKPTDAALAESAVPAKRPALLSRAKWGADESIVRAAPSVADDLELSVVHHTAGTNSYSKAESAAIVRGIQRYHVLGNGWNDIGYNFLVDKYGQIFEGRGGGVTRNVVGAHAAGFNTGSVGVAVLGTYGSRRISSAARTALEKLLAWRLDVGHVDPVSRPGYVTFGNERFKAGTTVRLRAVSGHRDTGYTSCPGTALYGQLGAIAEAVSTIGLPKLYDPEVSGAVGGPVRFTGRLSASRSWLVEVKDAGGAVVARGNGSGRAVDWTWDASTAPFGSYTYTMSSGADVRAASGPVPSPPPLDVLGLTAKPSAITPNGDGSGDQTAISFTLTRRATVAVRVVNAANGNVVRTLLASGERPAGPYALSWSGQNAGGAPAGEGTYRVEVAAESGSEQVTRTRTIVLDRTLGSLVAWPAAVSPNGDGRHERLRVRFTLTRQASVRVEMRRNGRVLATVRSGSLAAGTHTFAWAGLRDDGKRVGDGTVSAVVLATTSLGTRSLAAGVTVDTARPVLRVLSARRSGGVVRVRVSLSEAVSLRMWYGRQSWREGRRIVKDRSAGVQWIRRRVKAHVLRYVAVDAAGNRSPAVVRRF